MYNKELLKCGGYSLGGSTPTQLGIKYWLKFCVVTRWQHSNVQLGTTDVWCLLTRWQHTNRNYWRLVYIQYWSWCRCIFNTEVWCIFPRWQHTNVQLGTTEVWCPFTRWQHSNVLGTTEVWCPFTRGQHTNVQPGVYSLDGSTVMYNQKLFKFGVFIRWQYTNVQLGLMFGAAELH